MTEFFFFFIIAAAIIVIAVWAWVRVNRSKMADWSSQLDEEAAMMVAIEREMARRQANVAEALAFLRSKDERFSRAVLEDFLYALFAAVHKARGEKRLDVLAPYLDENVLSVLKGRRVSGVRDIIVGGMRTESVLANPSARRVLMTIVFTANYTEGEGNGATSYYVEERWKLSRGADAQSRKPDVAAVIGCPNCGAPLEKLVDEKCRYCNQVTRSADFDWRVEAIEETGREARGPILTGLVEEVGTDEPTKVAFDARKLYAELSQRDPAFDWQLFLARVELVFRTFHEAWSNRDLKPMRPYLSDALFETERYWVTTYLEQKLRNVTERRHLVSVELVRVVRDAFYDSLTVRLFAECVDYTIDEAGVTVGGRRDQLRQYSEYWTFLRSKNASGAPKSEPGCPNCGAPTEQINMAGECASCEKKVTMGEFDWVLSRIEQDETFQLDG